MSYILDALKKSEQDRGHGSIPDVQTVHSSSLNYRSEKRAYWPYILITAVVLNLLAITYFLIEKNTPSDKQAIEVPAVEKQAVAEHVLAAQDKTIETDSSNVEITKPAPELTTKPEPAVTSPAEPVRNPVKKQAVIETSTSADSNTINSESTIIDFHDLPESIKLQLPAIIVSAHVYSSNPAQRSIVINNNFMEEGDYVLDGLILIEITSNGAIFNFDGTMFNYSVVSGWQ